MILGLLKEGKEDIIKIMVKQLVRENHNRQLNVGGEVSERKNKIIR